MGTMSNQKTFPPVPTWLDPSAEVKDIDPPWSRHMFQVECINTLRMLGCDIEQAVGVTAHMMLESGRGQKFRAWNLGGVKLWQSTARQYKQATGKSIPWWRDWGHQSQGDPEVCYYRAYEDFGAFLRHWLNAYVPRLTEEPLVRKSDPKRGLRKGQPLLSPETSADYRLAGAHFHRLNGRLFVRWFEMLLKAGYRGAKTKQLWKAAQSIHESLEIEARVHWAQSRLGVAIDGDWGPRSRAACEQYQRSKGLTVTGVVDDALLESLVLSV